MTEDYQKKIARERIEILFSEAKENPSMSKRYIKLAKKTGMRYNVRLGRLKRRFCSNCYSYFTAKNSQTRTARGTISIKCLSCNNVKRIKIK